MRKELRMNVEFTHPETGELQPAILQAILWPPSGLDSGSCDVYITFADGNFVRSGGHNFYDAMDGL